MFPANNLDKYFQELEQAGWSLIPVSANSSRKLRKSADLKLNSPEARPAGVSESLQPLTEIRNDRIVWLNEPAPGDPEQEAFAALTLLTAGLKNYFRMSLSGFECHYSVYETGHYYRKHRDTTQHDNRRYFSFVIYLNDDWQKEDAGELIGYRDELEIFRVTPAAGRMILFRSDLEHEVKPTLKSRYALTGWIRQ